VNENDLNRNLTSGFRIVIVNSVAEVTLIQRCKQSLAMDSVRASDVFVAQTCLALTVNLNYLPNTSWQPMP